MVASLVEVRFNEVYRLSEEETMNLPPPELYETDFYAWIQEQINLLHKRNLNSLDIENLIEELDSLGKQQKKELVSLLVILVGHLLKWEYQPSKRTRSWIKTIFEHRKRIKDLIEESPSLQPFSKEVIEKAYPRALNLAVGETGIKIQKFPSEIPYSWESINDPNFFPGRLTEKSNDLLELYGISPISDTQISES